MTHTLYNRLILTPFCFYCLVFFFFGFWSDFAFITLCFCIYTFGFSSLVFLFLAPDSVCLFLPLPPDSDNSSLCFVTFKDWLTANIFFTDCLVFLVVFCSFLISKAFLEFSIDCLLVLICSFSDDPMSVLFCSLSDIDPLAVLFCSFCDVDPEDVLFCSPSNVDLLAVLFCSLCDTDPVTVLSRSLSDGDLAVLFCTLSGVDDFVVLSCSLTPGTADWAGCLSVSRSWLGVCFLANRK